ISRPLRQYAIHGMSLLLKIRPSALMLPTSLLWPRRHALHLNGQFPHWAAQQRFAHGFKAKGEPIMLPTSLLQEFLQREPNELLRFDVHFDCTDFGSLP